MTAFVVEPTTIDVAGVVELLERAVGGDDRARLDRACARYCAGPAGLTGVFAERSVIGVVGYFHHTDCRGTLRCVELLHIATDPRWERQGVGAALVEWVQAEHPGDPIETETDGDAVGFYRAIGFDVASLGQRYPGVERFRVVLRPNLIR
ncbi:GNAT family N-acetyltransferase [Rhodococcus artemisiae]|uniref:GNAT family N-acetyltransferase n=1 Tax=Rhodococcus artemisiae TaxID=714159 RepID=A0ABU7L3B1_9NOCA|nr:GNAT family N-acetyltransferase [Rhodococcus artemisiae]MEE2056029.1 GNAT family N-acetyltransferase [Rhodococcus artemisiae]